MIKYRKQNIRYILKVNEAYEEGDIIDEILAEELELTPTIKYDSHVVIQKLEGDVLNYMEKAYKYLLEHPNITDDPVLKTLDIHVSRMLFNHIKPIYTISWLYNFLEQNKPPETNPDIHNILATLYKAIEAENETTKKHRDIEL